MLLDTVKEEKTPLWDKFKEECPDSNFFKLYVQGLLKKAMDEKVKDQLAEEGELKQSILPPDDL